MPTPQPLLRPLPLLLALLATTSALPAREVINFNGDWRFLRDDIPAASGRVFSDFAWQVVSLPHTYNDTDTFDNWSLPGHRGEQEQWSGRTWYRKTFRVPPEWRGRRVFIEFEAVRQIAEVYLNGTLLGTARSGFTPFGFDLTDALDYGRDNLIAVMVDNRFQRDPTDPALGPQAPTSVATQQNLAQLSRQLMEQIPDNLEELRADQIPWNNPHWHPAHGGIYRNVRLIVTDPLHITLPLYSFLETEGPYVYAKDITADAAQVGVEVPVRNFRDTDEVITITATFHDADSRAVHTLRRSGQVRSGALGKVRILGTLRQPRLWEPGHPHIYRVEIQLATRAGIIDSVSVPLGVRDIRWDTQTGLWINGAHVKLHGWGQKATNEWPGLGAALPDWLQAYTLQLMKEAGGNFVRWGHVAGSPAQIAAGDALGLVTIQPGVDGEHDTRGAAWRLRADTFRDVLIYFRNNPSIFIWEGGNQKVSREHASELRALMDEYDPHGSRAYAHRRADAITAEFMHVGIGTEGGREIASLPVVEGEYDREESPRRVWDEFSPPSFGYPEARGQTYQLTSEQFAVNQVHHYVTKLGADGHAGGANWIFSDTTSGGRVSVEVARASGEVDAVRLPKEAWHVCRVMFTCEPRVHIIGHWTYPAATRKTVHVVANTGGEVELLLNGRPLGRARPVDRFHYEFADVAYAPGTLQAVAYAADGAPAATDTRTTTGPAVALRLTPITGPDGWRADGADVVLFDVEAVDASGARVPTFQDRVDFHLEGDGVWRGGYNSGRVDSINHPWLDLEAGINRVSVRSTRTPGRITLTVTHPTLARASVSLESVSAAGRPPAWPKFPLPAAPLRQPAALAPHPPAAAATAAGQAGRFARSLLYSGPAASSVHLETGAARGRKAYVDLDWPLPELPPTLLGADWVQTAQRDALYHAVDLMELTVLAGTTVTIAHDDRLPRPAWLTHDFKPGGARLRINGQMMTLFTRLCTEETGLTLGPNTESTGVTAANMYLVFVNGR